MDANEEKKEALQQDKEQSNKEQPNRVEEQGEALQQDILEEPVEALQQDILEEPIEALQQDILEEPIEALQQDILEESVEAKQNREVGEVPILRNTESLQEKKETKGLWKGVLFFFLCFILSFVLGAALCYFYFFGFPRKQENKAGAEKSLSSSVTSPSDMPESGEAINLPRVTEKLRRIQDLLSDSYLYQENGKEAEDMIYKGFLTSLLQDDPYAAYYTKEEIEASRNQQKGIYQGIGAAVSQQEGGPLVEYVYPGSPAEKGGLQAGDIVLRVDGISVENLSLNYIVENLIKGLDGSSLEMVVNRKGEEVVLRITRGEVVIPGSEVGDVAEMLQIPAANESGEDLGILGNLKQGEIGYLSLRGFYMEAVDSFISQYEAEIAGKKKALVIDLRGNPGGDVEAATKLLDYFLPDQLQKPKRKDSASLSGSEGQSIASVSGSEGQSNASLSGNKGQSIAEEAGGAEGSVEGGVEGNGSTQAQAEESRRSSTSVLEVTPNPDRQFEKNKTLLLYTENKWGKGKEWYAKDGHEVDIPIIILMNQNSASASELFAGTMQDYDRAWVFGTISYGKGIVQTVRSFPDGSAVEFTTHYYFTPAGRNIHKKGITPDLTVEMPEADQFSYLRDRTKDLQLRKAAESLYINFIHDKNSP